MFTGIITDIGAVSDFEARPEGAARARIACGYVMESVAIGASIACSGICLTVAAKESNAFTADLSPETLARTTAKSWREGTRLNLERALRMGDELGGHIVTGHVDGVAEVIAVEEQGETRRFRIRPPAALLRFIAEKGSVALDGVSLTVNQVEETAFWVHLIPHTLAVTTAGEWKVGSPLNIEADMLARYAVRALAFANT